MVSHLEMNVVGLIQQMSCDGRCCPLLLPPTNITPLPLHQILVMLLDLSYQLKGEGTSYPLYR